MNKPESSLDEWLDKAKRLIYTVQDWSVMFGRGRCTAEEKNQCLPDLLAHLAAHPSNQVQEPVAWMVWWGIGDMRSAWPPHRTREEAQQAASQIKSNTEVRPLYASPQAVPSEQPIAEQPQSDKANLMVAVGTDLPPAQLEDTRDAFEQWAEHEGYPTNKVPYATCSMGLPVYADTRTHAAWWAYQTAVKARVEPVVGPLSSARSDLPSMPPPAASLPVSAPAGVRMLNDREVRKLMNACVGQSPRDLPAAIQRRFAEVNGLKLATTKEN